MLLGLSTNKRRRKVVALDRVGRILISNKSSGQMIKAINTNIMVSQREIKRGKKMKLEFDIFQAAKRLFDV